MFKPIFSFIVLVLSVVFGFLYVMPEYNRMQERRSDLAKLTQISKDAGEIEELISLTETTLNTVDSTNRARFAVFLPEAPNPIRLANNLQRIGLTNGVVLQDIKVEESAVGIQGAANGISAEQGKGSPGSAGASTASGEKKYATTKSSFTFTATHEVFRKFLFSTEESLGLINITALSFEPVPVVTDTKKPKQVGTPLYQYAVAVETYSLK